VGAVQRSTFLRRWSTWSADTIGFLSQPNLLRFRAKFPDKRAKPNQVVGVGDVPTYRSLKPRPAVCSRPDQAAGRTPRQLRDLPAQAVDQKASIMFRMPARFPPLPEPTGIQAGDRCPAAQSGDRA